MSTVATDYGVVSEPGAIRFERLLPGPIERVWEYLTVPGRRRLWLADGPMDLVPGGEMELVWNNSELAGPDETVPERYAPYAGEHRMKGRIIRVEPPHLLIHSWDEGAEVVYELAERGDEVLLTLTNRKLPNRAALVDVAGGWHTHLEVLRAKLEGRDPPRFWDMVDKVERDYAERL